MLTLISLIFLKNCKNDGRGYCWNGIVRVVRMLAKKRVIYFGTLALENQSRFTKVANFLFSMPYRTTLVTLYINIYGNIPKSPIYYTLKEWRYAQSR